ncbi:MAG: Ig domain-containing protein [Clostridia bacterium]|nr:Ig domain-containing protein [Clostridia bacterium]
MKGKKKIFTLVMGLAMALCSVTALTACNNNNNTAEEVTITISQKEMEMVVGESAQLDVAVEPTDAMDKTITWKSSDEKIVTVKNGKVTAVAEGEAVVTATTNKKSDSCKVTVFAPAATENGGKEQSGEGENSNESNGSNDETSQQSNNTGRNDL